jgi:hypothetical protein
VTTTLLACGGVAVAYGAVIWRSRPTEPSAAIPQPMWQPAAPQRIGQPTERPAVPQPAWEPIGEPTVPQPMWRPTVGAEAPWQPTGEPTVRVKALVPVSESVIG